MSTSLSSYRIRKIRQLVRRNLKETTKIGRPPVLSNIDLATILIWVVDWYYG